MDNKNAVISVNNLSKQFRVAIKKGGFKASLVSLFHRQYRIVHAVNAISFNIEEGELVAFLGPNGAGKTTTLKMLSGILYPSSGSVSVLGYLPYKRQKAFQKQITLVLGQKNQLWWDLPPIDSFLLNKEIYGVESAQYKKTVDELVELLQISDVLQIPVRKLSLGQRMKCELICSLIHKPKVLFLDEPTIGLDIVMQKNMRKFLKEYNKRYNTTILLTSHYMDDVKEVCKRIILINKGIKVYDGLLSDLIKQYANEKYLVIDFDKEVRRSDFESYGRVVHCDSYSVTLAVPMEEHTQVASKILKQFPVDNIDIREVELEDIMVKLFSKS